MSDIKKIYVERMGETGDIRIKVVTTRNVKIDGDEIKLYLTQEHVEDLLKKLQKFV